MRQPFWQLRLRKFIDQVLPFDIDILNQLDLPPTLPFLEQRLAVDSSVDAVKDLKIHQVSDAVPLRKSFKHTFTMLPDAVDQIACHANVECAVATACENVDVIE